VKDSRTTDLWLLFLIHVIHYDLLKSTMNIKKISVGRATALSVQGVNL
jgi:hypothetical protein